jgi:hypothetical protein
LLVAFNFSSHIYKQFELFGIEQLRYWVIEQLDN